MRRGNALLLALWTIAVLSVMVVSFVYEAHQQSGVNVYVRERNRVNRLMDAGQALAEVVLTGYRDAPEWAEDQELEKMLEKDRWVVEKQTLKSDAKCTVGPILLDDRDTTSGTVTIDIQTVNSGETGIININDLWKNGGDEKYVERWWMIFRSHGIPEELATEREGTINLWNVLISSWDDWRDEDDDLTQMDGADTGAERDWYEEYDDDHDIDEEDRKRPRNGRIPDIRELSYVRGFRDYPQILTGGVINPWADKDDQISVRGIENLFCTEGTMKININSCKSVDALVTVPGVYEDPSEDDAVDIATGVAQMIIDGLAIMPETRDVDETRTWWPYKDWDDLVARVDEDIGSDAGSYFSYALEDTTIFKVKITGESMGMKHEVNAECYVKDKKVRYIKWRED